MQNFRPSIKVTTHEVLILFTVKITYCKLFHVVQTVSRLEPDDVQFSVMKTDERSVGETTVTSCFKILYFYTIPVVRGFCRMRQAQNSTTFLLTGAIIRLINITPDAFHTQLDYCNLPVFPCNWTALRVKYPTVKSFISCLLFFNSNQIRLFFTSVSLSIHSSDV